MAANAPENVRRLLAWQKKNPPEVIPEAHPTRYNPDGSRETWCPVCESYWQ